MSSTTRKIAVAIPILVMLAVVAAGPLACSDESIFPVPIPSSPKQTPRTRVLHERQFLHDATLRAHAEDLVVVELEHPMAAAEGLADGDTAAAGVDEIPYVIDWDMSLRFCIEGDKKHQLSVLNEKREELLRVKPGDTCITQLLPRGSFTLRFTHDGSGAPENGPDNLFVHLSQIGSADWCKHAGDTPGADTVCDGDKPRKAGQDAPPKGPQTFQILPSGSTYTPAPGEVVLYQSPNYDGGGLVVDVNQPLWDLTAFGTPPGTTPLVKSVKLGAETILYAYSAPDGPSHGTNLFLCDEPNLVGNTHYYAGGSVDDAGLPLTDISDHIASAKVFTTTTATTTINKCNDCDLRDAHFDNATLSNTSLLGADLSNAFFGGAHLTGVALGCLTGQGLPGKDCVDPGGDPCPHCATARKTDFTGATLSTVDLSKALLEGAKFPMATLSGVNFAGATLSNATFTSATLTGDGFSGAALSMVDFTGASFTCVDFSTVVSQSPATDTTVAVFGGPMNVLTAADPSLCPPNYAVSPAVPSSLTNFTGSIVRYSALPLVALPAGVTDCGLVAAGSIAQVDLSYAKITRVPKDATTANKPILSKLNLNRATLVGQDFHDFELIGSCFQWADVSRADLGLADLSHADFTQATLIGTTLTAAYINPDIGPATFLQAHCDGNPTTHDFTAFDYAYLPGSSFSGAVLTYASFTYTDLSAIDLSSATLSHANLANARLDGATLASVAADSANLTGATMIGATLKGQNPQTGTSMQGAQLQQVNFCNAIIDTIDWTGANLTQAAMDIGNAELTLPDGGPAPCAPAKITNTTTTATTVCPDGSFGPCAPTWDDLCSNGCFKAACCTPPPGGFCPRRYKTGAPCGAGDECYSCQCTNAICE